MKNLIVLFATLLLSTVTAFSQVDGRVVDAKGAGVPKVSITATVEDGAVAATVTSDEEGNYAFKELSPGKYKITAKGPAGFQPAAGQNVDVAEDETTTLNITLTAAVQVPLPKPPVKPAATSAITLDEIINRHITALGGREKLLSLKTVRMTSTLTVQGYDVYVTMTRSHLIGLRVDINVPGLSPGYRIVTPTKCTTFLPMQGQTSPEDMPDVECKSGQAQLDIQGALLDYRAKGTSVELLGTEKVDGEDNFKLKVTFKSGGATFLISSRTYLITKTMTNITINGEPTDIETNCSNYKKNADGYLFPYTIANAAGETNYDKIETNIAVDPAIFK